VDIRREQGRAATAATGSDRLPPTPPDAADALAILEAGGVRLAPSGQVDPDTPEGPVDDVPRRKLGYWTPADRPGRGRGRVQLRLYEDADAAHAAYLRRRTAGEQELIWPPVWPLLVARYGRLLLEARASRDEAHSTVWAAIDALGEPDERWLTDQLPIPADGLCGTVLATRVSVPAPLSIGTAALVGDNPATIEHIAGYLNDEHDRARVLATNLEQHSILMLHGLADMAGVLQAQVRELADSPQHERRYALELELDEPRFSTAVVLTIDAMPVRPTEIILTGLGRGKGPTFRVFSR
jgi:hypothetical protein